MAEIRKTNIFQYLKTKYNNVASIVKMNGTQSAGSSDYIARADHVHPTDTSRAASNHSHGSLVNDGALNSDITSVNKVAVTDATNKLKTISKLPLDKVTHQDISGKANVNHSHDSASSSANGFLSKEDKSKLDGIATEANKTVVDSSLSSSSTNPVQNKVINSALSGKANSSHSHSITDVTNLQSSLDSKAGTSIATTSANGLMSSSDKTKLNGIATGATKVTVDTSLSSSSTNPVQNKVINTAMNDKTNINTRDFSFFLSDVILPEGSSIADKSITRSHVHDTIQIPYKQSTQEGYRTDTFNLENFDLFLSWSPNSLGTNSNIQFILLNPETNEKISVVCTPQQGRTWVDIVCDSGTNRTYDQKGTYGNVAGKYFGLIFKVRRDKLSYVLCDDSQTINTANKSRAIESNPNKWRLITKAGAWSTGTSMSYNVSGVKMKIGV